MLKSNLIKNKRAGSAGDTMSLVVTFAILLLIFVFAFIWTKGISIRKSINLENVINLNENPSMFISSPVILCKNLISQQLSQKLNSGDLENEE